MLIHPGYQTSKNILPVLCLGMQTLFQSLHLALLSLTLHLRYTEADIIPCTGEEPGEAKEREALRGAVLK